MSKNDTTGYFEVGYGKPPKEGQFKKGQSGNPKGRPKKKEKATTFAQMFEEYMHGKVDITVNGKSKKTTRMKAFVMKAFRDAMNGDPRGSRQMMGMIKQLGLLDPNTRAEPSAFLEIREAFPEEVELAIMAMQQAPFRDGHKPPLSDEVLEQYGLKKPDKK